MSKSDEIKGQLTEHLLGLIHLGEQVESTRMLIGWGTAKSIPMCTLEQGQKIGDFERTYFLNGTIDNLNA